MSTSQSPAPQGLAQPSLAQLSSPVPHHISSLAMDYFLIEMTSTLRDSAAFASKKQKEIESEMRETGLVPPVTGISGLKRDKERESSARDSVTSLSSNKGAKMQDPEDREEEPLRQRLEQIGMHVGANFAERCVFIIWQ